MTYEYKCDECGTALEIRATMAEKERGLDIACPRCGSLKVSQVFTTLNVLTHAGRDRSPGSGCGPDAGGGCCG